MTIVMLMGIFGQIILGVLIVVGGVLLLKYNYQVTNSMPIGFAEQHMGSGGSYLLWKILSILVIFAGLTVVFGVYDNILAWLVSPLTNAVGGSS
jgi:hypothetical protein